MPGRGLPSRATRLAVDSPALQRIHQFAWRVQAFPHQGRLLAHGDEGILEEARLILGYRGIRHVGKRRDLRRLRGRVLSAGSQDGYAKLGLWHQRLRASKPSTWELPPALT